MWRRRRQGNSTPQKNNSIEDLLENEENEYPLADPNRTMINITNELSDIQKNLFKRKSWKRSWRKSWRSYKTWLNRRYKINTRYIKILQVKNLRRQKNN
jgi:hypothetical protein